MAEELSLAEKKVLVALGSLREASPAQVAERTGQSGVEVMNASSWLRAKQLLHRDEALSVSYALGPEGQAFAEKGLPERRLCEVLERSGGSAPLASLAQQPEFSANPDEVKIATGQAKRKGLIEIVKEPEHLVLAKEERPLKEVLTLSPEERAVVQYIAEKPEMTIQMGYSGLENNLSNVFINPHAPIHQVIQKLLEKQILFHPHENEPESIDLDWGVSNYIWLPEKERRVIEELIAAGGSIDVGVEPEGFERIPKKTYGSAIQTLRKSGWIEVLGGEPVARLTEKGHGIAAGELMPDERVLEALKAGEKPEAELDRDALRALMDRQNVLRKRETVAWTLRLTPKGQALVDQGVILEEGVAQLTPELLQTGKWREVKLRPYDVTTFAPELTGGKKHPLRRIVDDIRGIFLELGFEEIEGPFVHTTFWDMDALFIPQDHPAREMQDTFYLDEPRARTLPTQGKEASYVRTVAAVHERGGKTGSRGWGYAWSRAEAERTILRTHTTVETIQRLVRSPEAPVKAFMVGRVFRKEAMDATHLPEFHQVEGIVMEEGANLRMLVGLLKEFYAKMGFPEVQVRPSYYPYTEPSLDVAVRWNDRWLELGGAGIFRPEVTKPAGVKHPVLAWGLGLERLAMMRLGLKDIRQLYESDLEWLRRVPAKF